MTGNFPTWWAFCQAADRDGHANDTDPTDGAGVTRWGFTFATWCQARRYAGYSDISLATFMKMTQPEAEFLALDYFWDRLGADAMPAGSDISVIDWCWTSGGAVMEMQTHLGVQVDGIIGMMTIGAINKMPPREFIEKCHEWRIAYYDALGLQTKYPGDYNRADYVLSVGDALIGNTPPPVAL